MAKNITLFRPVGAEELVFIIDSGMKSFPPRLYWQPIFYPVLNFQYAAEIAERWNMGDTDGDGAGFVTQFEIPEGYIEEFAIQTVGLAHHQELWVPAERLDEFNRNIVEGIRVTKAFLGNRFVVPDKIKQLLTERK
ncbi:MAG TPA: hypothetical protein VFE50_06275 [Cyclobacteriaceae bacterium]|nr:hypothetical protein [Cyclobacteriaceae bacterium]